MGIFGLSLLCLLVAACAEPESIPWPMYGGNAQRSGQSRFNGPQGLKLKWTYVPESGSIHSAITIDVDGTVYLTSAFTLSNENTRIGIVAINGSTGCTKWIHLTNGAVSLSAPAVTVHDQMLLTHAAGRLSAISKGGVALWNITLKRNLDAVYSSGSFITTHGGRAYLLLVHGVGPFNRTLFAINISDQVIDWTYQLPLINSTTEGKNAFSYPLVGGNGSMVVVADYKFTFYCLYTSDGQLSWKSVQGDIRYGHFVVWKDLLIVGGFAEDAFEKKLALRAIDIFRGSTLWTTYTSSDLKTSSALELEPRVSDAGIIYLFGWPYFYAFNATTGELVWNVTMSPDVPIGRRVSTPPAIAADGSLYCSSGPMGSARLNGTSGSLLSNVTTYRQEDIDFSINFEITSSSSPAIGAGGVLYHALMDRRDSGSEWYVYAFEEATNASQASASPAPSCETVSIFTRSSSASSTTTGSFSGTGSASSSASSSASTSAMTVPSTSGDQQIGGPSRDGRSTNALSATVAGSVVGSLGAACCAVVVMAAGRRKGSGRGWVTRRGLSTSAPGPDNPALSADKRGNPLQQRWSRYVSAIGVRAFDASSRQAAPVFTSGDGAPAVAADVQGDVDPEPQGQAVTNPVVSAAARQQQQGSEETAAAAAGGGYEKFSTGGWQGRQRSGWGHGLMLTVDPDPGPAAPADAGVAAW